MVRRDSNRRLTLDDLVDMAEYWSEPGARGLYGGTSPGGEVFCANV